MPTPFVFVTHDFVPADQAALLVSDLAIQRGYGIFDFFKTLDHRPVFLEAHLDRFFHSASALRLPIGKTREELKAIIGRLMELNQIPDSGIRLTLTGGYAPDGYSIAGPNLVITQQPLAQKPSPDCPPPVKLISYAHQRQMPDTKTIDYLMAIWLQPYIREQDADDVLYQQNGIITECPRSNFFIVTADNTLVTPARNMLKGITRMKILEMAKEKYKTEERDIHLHELPAAREAFITSTGRQIVPVAQIDGITLEPGPVTRELNTSLYRLAISGKE